MTSEARRVGTGFERDDERGTGSLEGDGVGKQLGCPEPSRPWTAAAQLRTDWGVRPTWAQTGIPRRLRSGLCRPSPRPLPV